MTDAAARGTGPVIPESVERYLSDQGIDFETVPRRGSETYPRVENVLLADELGMVQAFLADDHLLDLKAVSEVTGRNLRAAETFERDRLLRKMGLQSLPALDGLTDMETLVDNAVPKRGKVVVHSGATNQFLVLEASALVRNQNRVTRASWTSPVEPADIEPDNQFMDLDLDAIEMSVSRFTAKRIRQRLEETLEIPPLPATAQKIVRLRVDPNADIARLASIIEHDPSLAAQVISWASSSYYAAPGTIKSVQDAIVRVLGYDLVMNLALGLALGRAIDIPGDAPEGYTPYWQEAIYTAELVSELHSAMPREFRPSFGLAYLGGLLHNFGYLVLAHVFKPHFSTCCRLWEANPHLEPQLIERHVLGITRDQIAASLLASWQLPEEVCRAIRFSGHGDYQGLHADYANLVYLATRLLRRSGMVNGPMQSLEHGVFSHLQLQPQDARTAMQVIYNAREDLNALARGMQPD